MPYKSMRQERFAHTEKGKKAFGKKNVAEFDQASKGLSLPEAAGKEPPKLKTRYTDLLKQI